MSVHEGAHIGVQASVGQELFHVNFPKKNTTTRPAGPRLHHRLSTPARVNPEQARRFARFKKNPMNDYCWFEYTATLTGPSHGPEGQDTLVHGVVEIRVMTAQGHQRSTVEMQGDVADLVLSTLHAGPSRCLSRSQVWQVDPGRLARLGKAPKVHYLGGSTVYLYAS
jgi:hypothetical protein